MSRKYKVVIFDYYGVLSSSLRTIIQKAEIDHGLPRNFIINLVTRNDLTKPSARVINGQITFTEFIPLFEKQLTAASVAHDVQLPENFSIQDFITDCMNYLRPSELLLDSITNLQEAGYKVCILCNVGIIDGIYGNKFTRTKMFLRSSCDYHIESCEVGLSRPDPKFYLYALNKMGIEPQDAISIESRQAHAAVAESLGLKAIIAVDQPYVLKALSELTGIDFKKLSRPVGCNEDNVAHCEFYTKSGVKIHYVEKGVGPAVILCHGFPEFWYSWRYQIPFLAKLGYRAIALDQRGYGRSDCPPNVTDYSLEKITQDSIDLLDILNIPQAVFIGHDWGSVVVWNIALHHPDRVKALASLNLGYGPAHPEKTFLQLVESNPAEYDYFFYFQKEGVAEAELEEDVDRTLRYVFSDTTPKNAGIHLDTRDVRKRGGLLVGLPQELPKCPFMSDKEFNCYVETFKRTGFRHGLKWYRNEEVNWKRDLQIGRNKIFQPTLMVTAEYDLVLKPSLTNGMEYFVPNLTRENLLCGHWMQSECPAELNRVLSKWLSKVCPNLFHSIEGKP